MADQPSAGSGTPAWASAPYFDGQHWDVLFSVDVVCASIVMLVTSRKRAERFTLAASCRSGATRSLKVAVCTRTGTT
jgi:hypothetical protein